MREHLYRIVLMRFLSAPKGEELVFVNGAARRPGELRLHVRALFRI